MRTIKKSITKAYTLILILTIALLILITPLTTAQFSEDGPITIAAYIGVSPKIVGVGDSILVTGWTSPVTRYSVGHPSHFKTGYVVTFTKPDGSTVDIDPLAGQGGITYEEGSFFTSYTPDQVGTWTAVLFAPAWPEWNLTAATSEPFTFEVQTESYYEPYPENPMPEEYWERPLPGDIRLDAYELSYWPIDGYDAADSRWNENSQAPDSAHVLWRIENYPAGVIGGEHGDLSGLDSYAAGATAQGWPILGGYAYITPWRGQTSHRMIDMDTGEEVWRKQFDGTVHFAVQPDEDLPHYRGINYVIYEAFNGEKVVVRNAHTAEELRGSSFAGGTVTDDRVGLSRYHDGYCYYTGQGHLLKWEPNVPGGDLNASSSFTTFTVHDKMVYRKPRPAGANSPSLYWEDIGVGGSPPRTLWNLTTGEVIWQANPDDETPGAIDNRYSNNNWEGGSSVGYGLFFDHNIVDRRTYAFSLATGQVVWKSEPRSSPYGAFLAYQMAVGEGVAIVEAYDGHVYAYDVIDGSTKWKFYAGDAGIETPYNTWPFWHAPAVADGKVFASNSEHSAQNPYYRGTRMFAINSETGQEVWSIGGSWAGKSIADGKLLVQCESTGELFCFARGPTETTISAPDTAIPLGDSVLISGMVVDISPATTVNEVAKRFPKGVPAVSEEYMSDWMEYLHLKRTRPWDVTGVPVELRVVHPDGTMEWIDTVTSDGYGNYAYQYNPPTEGIYRIMASFPGSVSYWPSHVETVFAIDPAPEPSTPIEPEPPTEPEEPAAPLITTEVAIIAAVAIIAIVGLAAYWVLRKRK
jgi:outer membrane protein assembly factor BamB